jgi:hypothetical protein
LGDLGARLAQPKTHLSEQALTLPHPQVDVVSPTQVLRQYRTVPERGGQIEVARSFTQIALKPARILRI